MVLLDTDNPNEENKSPSNEITVKDYVIREDTSYGRSMSQ